MDEFEVGWAIVVLSGEGGRLKEGLGALDISFFFDCRSEVQLLRRQERVFVLH